MTNLEKLGICAAASVLLHIAVVQALEHLDPLQVHEPPRPVEVRVVEAPKPPPPPPDEPKPPEPEKPPEPQPVPHELPKARPVKAPQVAAVAKDAPAPDHPAVQTSDTTDEPVFGVTMESTSQGGTTSAPVGNTLKPAPAGTGGPVKALAQPVAAMEATKLPMPQGRCSGKYTDEAKAAGVEGTVVLDVVVGEDGRVRDVQVTQGLPNGLSEAAVRALKECRFTPGEKDGKPVPVRVRGFKIHFVLQDAT